MLDWDALRLALAHARRDRGLSVQALADALGVALTTIYRIENVKGEPGHKPSLATVEAWTRACDLTLSEFFAALERSHNSHLPASQEMKQTADVPTPRTEVVDVSVSSAAISAAFDAYALTAAVIQLTETLDRVASGMAGRDQSAPVSRPPSAARRARRPRRDRKVG